MWIWWFNNGIVGDMCVLWSINYGSVVILGINYIILWVLIILWD